MSDWIEWKGGECPVAPDARVRVEVRDPDLGWDIASASTFSWKHLNSDLDIVRYKIIEEPKTTAIPTPSGLKSVEYDQPKNLTDAVNKVEAIGKGIESLQSKLDEREELRIRAAMAALTGLVSAPADSAFGAALSGFNGDPTSLATGMSLEIADAFIEELERRGK